MTSVYTRTVTKSWFVVVVPAPAWRADLYLALHWAEQEYEQVHGRKAETDNAFEVLANDQEIIVRFEIKVGG